jgi:sugar O-acyltransferase (sialic acid O-acetyltransferase NeuD family)
MRYNRIKAVLDEKELTQKWLAAHIGVSTVTVNFWCSNKSQPSLKTLFEIAEALQTPAFALIHEDEPQKKEQVLIVGASGHSKVIIDTFEKEGRYEIIGLLDTKKTKGSNVLGHTVLGTDDQLPELLKKYPFCKLFVAIGDNWIRQRVVSSLLEVLPNVQFASTIHPSVSIGKKTCIGKGVAILAGAVINCDTTIGDFAIVNTKAGIDHDSTLAEFSSLGPNAATGGNVSIGKGTAVGIAATIKHGVTIGNHTVIGAGAVVLNDCGDHVVSYGAPAKEIRSRKVGEPYL